MIKAADWLTIKCSNPGAQFRSHRATITEAIERVLDSGWYILGEEVVRFETEFAQFCGACHGIGVANDTEALALSLMALEIGRGDEVITVSHTAVATVAAIEQAGAVPILVDVEPGRYTLDPSQLAGAMSSAVKAIDVVHPYGQPADMDAIMALARANGSRAIEECAEEHSATDDRDRVGSIDEVGCFSVFPTKNLGALGDAGAVVTSDGQLSESPTNLPVAGVGKGACLSPIRGPRRSVGRASRTPAQQGYSCRVALSLCAASAARIPAAAPSIVAQYHRATDTPNHLAAGLPGTR